jgi:hypothetical protein
LVVGDVAQGRSSDSLAGEIGLDKMSAVPCLQICQLTIWMREFTPSFKLYKDILRIHFYFPY